MWYRLSLLLLLALAGCDKSSSPPASKEGDGKVTEKSGAPDADAAEQTKLAAAIECLNRHSNRVFEVRDAYLASVDPKTGAAAKGAKPSLMGLYGVDPCARMVKDAGAVTPAVEALDKASAGYVAALEALIAAYAALTGYYEKGEHLDDAGKKAETLHPPAMAAFDAFGVAHRALDAQVGELNRRRRVADLAAREKAEGRKLEVIIDTMMLEAETLVAMATATPPADPAALDGLIKAYGALVDEVDAYAAAHADEAKGRGSMTNLQNYAKTFLAAAKVVGRKRAEGAEPTEAERGAVIEQYNSLVTNYNNH
jgi:hypothetical protein